MIAPRILGLAAVLLVSACGRVADLEPAPGQPLPVKPLMARTTPTPEELLEIPTYARADRVDELMKRSEPRQQDPFNLPPPTGGTVPGVPAGSDPQPVDTTTTGPVPPGA
ncbi:MAG TPA: hypothetical protein VIL42_04790 [Sphingomicrobium sp.]|jgi:hypothetical protein